MKTKQKIAILGAGESGVGTAILAKKQGFEIFVSDFGKIKEKYKKVLEQIEVAWEEGGHTETRIINASVVMKSPGIPDSAPMVKKLVT